MRLASPKCGVKRAVHVWIVALAFLTLTVAGVIFPSSQHAYARDAGAGGDKGGGDKSSGDKGGGGLGGGLGGDVGGAVGGGGGDKGGGVGGGVGGGIGGGIGGLGGGLGGGATAGANTGGVARAGGARVGIGTSLKLERGKRIGAAGLARGAVRGNVSIRAGAIVQPISTRGRMSARVAINRSGAGAHGGKTLPPASNKIKAVAGAGVSGSKNIAANLRAGGVVMGAPARGSLAMRLGTNRSRIMTPGAAASPGSAGYAKMAVGLGVVRSSRASLVGRTPAVGGSKAVASSRPGISGNIAPGNAGLSRSAQAAAIRGDATGGVALTPGSGSGGGIIAGGLRETPANGSDVRAAFQSLSRTQQARVAQRCKSVMAHPAQAAGDRLAICQGLSSMAKR
jgi:hypothetical protein